MSKRVFLAAAMVAATMAIMSAPALADASEEVLFFDSGTGRWETNTGTAFYFGQPGDVPLFCDWDGDGVETVGAFRPSQGFVYLRNDNTAGVPAVAVFYGIPGDIPVCGDWDGDGADTLGVYRPGAGRFYLRNSNTQGFGDASLRTGPGYPSAFAGDFDGDGVDSVGVHDSETGRVRIAADDGITDGFFGLPGDRLLVGDWDGDGKDSFAAVRDDTLYLSDSVGATTRAQRVLKVDGGGGQILTGEYTEGAGLDARAKKAPVAPTPEPPAATQPAPVPADSAPAPAVPADARTLAANGVVDCSNCTLVGNGTYGTVSINGKQNVTLVGVTVDGKRDPGGWLQTGTVQVLKSANVTLRGVVVRNSPRSSFQVYDSTNVTLAGVESYDSWHMGLSVERSDGLVLRDSIIANPTLRIPTAPAHHDVGWESGGMKIKYTTGASVIGNEIYGGYGPGIWYDILNYESVIRDNYVHDMTAEGIFYEISGSAVIEGNRVVRAPNAVTSGRMSWLYGAGILVSTSTGVDVVGNTVEGSVHGITVIDQGWRGTKANNYDPGKHSVIGNTVRNVNKVGVATDNNDSRVFNGTWRDNTFENVKEFVGITAR